MREEHRIKPKIISIAGRSGSGKTTFLEKLLPHLKKRGYRVGVIKHAHCGVEMDKKGKDSWRHKKAGASATLVISPGLISMVKDYEDINLQSKSPNYSNWEKSDFVENEQNIVEKKQDIIENETETIERVKHYFDDMDIIILEGFKYAALPKLEIYRVAAGHDNPLFHEDKNFEALITDSDFHTDLPRFGLEDAEQVADFIEKKYIINAI